MGPEWFALLIPALGLAGVAFWAGRRLAWWEWLLVYPLVIGLTLGMKGCSETELTRDTEYWGSYVTHLRHENFWQEEVSCRHPIYCTRVVPRTRTVTDSKGNSTTETYLETETYECGREHPYDVDDHPPIWVAFGSGKQVLNVDQASWNRHCDLYGNVTEVPTGHSSVHGTDGKAWETTWPGTLQTVDPLAEEHTYVNRVQASRNIYRYPPVAKETVRQYGLYTYPKPQGYYLPCVLPPATYAGDEQISQLSALLGKKHQIRLWVLVFRDQPRQAGLEQEALWEGGNKNELVLTVGIDKERHIRWAHVFSWTPVEAVKVETRDWLQSQKTLDLPALVTFLQPLIEQKWRRRQFAEFSYLRVEMMPAQLAWLYGLTVLFTGGYLAWALTNGQDAPQMDGKRWNAWLRRVRNGAQDLLWRGNERPL
jgi:hypothetical protein